MQFADENMMSMESFFQIWDMTSGNLVTEFASEDEAIEALCDVRSEDGDGPILDFALFRFRDGHPTLIAKVRDLVRFLANAQTRSLTTATGG